MNIQNCQFRKNVSNVSPGAIWLNRNNGKVCVLNCSFEENSSESAKCGGGAICCKVLNIKFEKWIILIFRRRKWQL